MRRRTSTDTSHRVFETTAALFALLSLYEGEKNVGELLSRVGGARQPNISQHLGMRYRGGLLARRRKGSQMYYRISSQRVLLLCDAVCGDQQLSEVHAPGVGGAMRALS